VPYDFQVYQAYEDLPETGVRLGVMIEAAPAGHGLVVKGVLPGSNAERAGLQLGDLLLSLDGESLTEIFDLTYAVQQKHPGDRGVVQVERQGKTLKLEVVFMAAQKDHQHGKQ
jgi:S1-C subfamily serine protease